VLISFSVVCVSYLLCLLFAFCFSFRSSNLLRALVHFLFIRFRALRLRFIFYFVLTRTQLQFRDSRVTCASRFHFRFVLPSSTCQRHCPTVVSLSHFDLPPKPFKNALGDYQHSFLTTECRPPRTSVLATPCAVVTNTSTLTRKSITQVTSVCMQRASCPSRSDYFRFLSI
jgi:hypothetical protein